jgi:hypothetical protein
MRMEKLPLSGDFVNGNFVTLAVDTLARRGAAEPRRLADQRLAAPRNHSFPP